MIIVCFTLLCHVGEGLIPMAVIFICFVLAIVELVNMSCDKILNEVSFVYDKM